MEQERYVITSVAEFTDSVAKLNQYIKKKDGKRNSLLFRGQSDADNILLPSVGRFAGELIGEPFLREERNMVEMAKYKLPELFQNAMQPIDLLALLQHHGIPTRLLDISENALVALYFACSGDDVMEKDGEVLIFNYRNDKIENYPLVNAIADSYRFISGDRTYLTDFYGKTAKQSYMREQEAMNPEEGAERIAECCSDIMLIYAKSYGLRQRIQRGRYILFPNSICEDEEGRKYFEQKINPISKEHKAIEGRYVIPAECKKRILEDLQIFGISREMLFLDNVDIICKEIAERARSESMDRY